MSAQVAALAEDPSHWGSWLCNLPNDACTARWTTSGALCTRPGHEQFGDSWLCIHHARRLDDDLMRKARSRAITEAARREQEREADLADANARSVVYYLQRADELIKIGYSSRFRERFATLQREHGPLALLVKHGGNRDAEQAMHRRFADDRVEGEWFLPSDDLWAHINDVRARQERRTAVVA